MTDWYGREGAELGRDLERDQAEAIRDRADRRHDFRETVRYILDQRGAVVCGVCVDEVIDLSEADDVDQAIEIWEDHVREVHDDRDDREKVPIPDGGTETSDREHCEECGWVGDREDCTEWEGTVACPYCANVIKQNADPGDSIRTGGGEVSDNDRKTVGFVHVHTEIGNREGVIVELRPEWSDHPSERDMAHLSDERALELYNQLREYFDVEPAGNDRQRDTDSDPEEGSR